MGLPSSETTDITTTSLLTLTSSLMRIPENGSRSCADEDCGACRSAARRVIIQKELSPLSKSALREALKEALSLVEASEKGCFGSL